MLDNKILKKYIESSGLSFRQNSVSYIFDCPRCNKRNKLFLRKKDGRFVCWVCKETDNFQGKPEYALAELQVLPVSTVRASLYGEQEREGVVTLSLSLKDFFGEDDEVDEEATELASIAWPWNYYPIDDPQYSGRGAAYLAGRGISLELAMEYGLRYCPERRRVAFPIELGGRLLGFQERTVMSATKFWDDERGEYLEMAKVLSSKGIPRDRTFMFADRLANQRHAVLCEGPIDAIKAHLCGANVAAMGKAVSRGQLDFLRNQGIQRLYLDLDPDAADETSRIARQFADIELYSMQPSGYKDLGEMPLEAVRELFLSAPRIKPGRLFVYLDRKAGVL